MSSSNKVITSLHRHFNSVLVRDIYTSPVVTVDENDLFSVVEDKFRKHRIKHLPIVSKAKKLKGLMTMSDLHRIIPPKRNFKTQEFYYVQKELNQIDLQKKMTPNPNSLKELNTLMEVLEHMVGGGYGCIPVVDDQEKVLGIVTQTDVIVLLNQAVQSLKSDDHEGGKSYAEMLDDIKLKVMMSYPPIVLSEEEELSVVEKTLRESRIKHLPIVNASNELSGIVTISDLYQINAPRVENADGTVTYKQEMLDKYILKHWMTKNPTTLTPDNSLLNAMERMVAGKYGCIIITDNVKHIKGIITQTDVIKAILKITMM